MVFESQINYENMSNYVTEYVTKIKPLNKKDEMIERNGRNYSIFGFSVKFKRHTKPYLWIYYVPSMSVVSIAGCSFIGKENGTIIELALKSIAKCK